MALHRPIRFPPGLPTRRDSGGSGTGGAPTAAAGRHRCWTDDSLLPRRLGRAGGGGAGEEGPALLFLLPPLAAARVEAQLEGLLLRLALAGPAGYLKNALLRRRLGVVLPTVPDLAGKK